LDYLRNQAIAASIIYPSAISYKKVYFMTFDQIMFFLAIVKQQNFTHAADNMFISQSSLSKQIKAIENELGVTLFSRDTHRIELTEAGKIFLPFAIKFLKNYSDMVYNLSFFSNNQKSIFTIRVGMIPILCYSGLINQLINLELNNPNMHLDFVEREQSELLKMLDRNQIDFAIARIDYLSPDDYNFLPLVSEDLGILCSVKCPWASKRILNLRDLEHESFVLPNSTSGLYKRCIDAFRNAGFTPKVNYVSSRHEVLLAMVNNSLNLTLLPKNLLSLEYSPKIKYIPLQEHLTSTIALVRNKETESNQKINAFQAMIKEHFKG
jgi:LysR family transcriptional activator of glutamate synthase operon